MLVSIRVTMSTTTTTRLCRRWGAEDEGLKHNKGHRCQQQQNSDNDETLTTTTLTMMLVYQQQQRQRLRDANGDNGNN